MADGDDVPLHKVDGKEPTSESPLKLNEQLRQISMRLAILEGRIGQVPFRNSVSLLGVSQPSVSASDSCVYVYNSATGRLEVSEAGAAFVSLTHPSIPACRVYKSTGQSIPDTALTAITFDTERFDTDFIHSTSTNTSRLTIRTAGLYAFGGHLRFASNATGTRVVNIQLNAGFFLAPQNHQASATQVTQCSVSTIYQMNKGDYVELIAFQDSGGPLNVTATVASSPEFWCYRISD